MKDLNKPVTPGVYAQHEFGVAEFEAIGRLIVQIIEQLAGYQYKFESIAAANAFWKAMVQLVDGQLYVRESIGKDSYGVPRVDFEGFVTNVMDEALDEDRAEAMISEQNRTVIIALVHKLIPDHPRALLLQAAQAQEREEYALAIALYEKVTEIFRRQIPEQTFKEKDKVERSALFRYTGDGREYM